MRQTYFARHVLASFTFVFITFGCLPSASAQHSDPDETEAKTLYELGADAYGEERYEAALRYFRASHEASGHPELLFNMAECQDRLHQDQEALASFDRYLQEKPDAHNRDYVTGRRRELHIALGERYLKSGEETEAMRHFEAAHELGEHPELDMKLAEARRQRRSEIAPWVTMGGGAAVAVVGSVLMISGKKDAAAVRNNITRDDRYLALQSSYDSANRRWVVGQVLVGVGVAAVAGGVVWKLVGDKSADAADADGDAVPTVEISVGLQGVQLRGQF